MSPRWLILFLRIIGVAACFAFLAAIMPSHWMIEIAEELRIDFPSQSPLAFYLARNLSLLYGYVGAALLLIAADLTRYRPLVRWAAYGTLSFALLQAVVDSMAGMPAWWTWGESGSTLLGGGLLWWLDRHTRES